MIKRVLLVADEVKNFVTLQNVSLQKCRALALETDRSPSCAPLSPAQPSPSSYH